MYLKYLKRLLDVVISSIALIALMPILLVTAVLVRINLDSPILFKQRRPGKDERLFTIYKFKTMSDERDEFGELMPDSIRLTTFGRFLRSTSLDELPELWNILKGDMSFVGPRPLLTQYLQFYDEHQKHRHDILPGLTGWAQVNGRNAIEWEDKFKYDIEYVNNISIWLDMRIIWLTIVKVFKREGINQQGEATMGMFNENASFSNREYIDA